LKLSCWSIFKIRGFNTFKWLIFINIIKWWQMDGWKLPWVHFTFRCISIFVVFFYSTTPRNAMHNITKGIDNKNKSFKSIKSTNFKYWPTTQFQVNPRRNWVVGQYLKFVDLILLNDLFLLSMPFVMLCIAFRGVVE
jgi:hypothetical protein